MYDAFMNKKREENILNIIENNQPIVFNALFISFILILQKPITSIAQNAVSHQEVNVFFGSLIFTLIAIEMIALKIKFQSLRQKKYFLNIEKNAKISAILTIAWVLHLVAISALTFLAVAAFGVDLDSQELHPLLFLYPIMIIKELFIFGYFSDLDKPTNAPVSTRSVILSNIFLAAFASITYIAWQGVTASSTPIEFDITQVQFWFNSLITAFIFLIFFIPMHLGFIVEEIVMMKNKTGATKLILSYAVATLVAITPVLYF
jgi:hypothetical protein